MNLALLKAINEDAKKFEEGAKDRTEVGFLLDNWQMFTCSKTKILEAKKYLPDPTADSLLNYLGITTVMIEKVEEVKLKSACYDMTQSAVWKNFKEHQKKVRDLTVFYTCGKQGIVVTNQYILEPAKDFYHKLPLEKSSDVYWCSIRQAKENKFQVY